MADDGTGQDQEQRLNEVMAGYVQAVEAGWALDRRELVARNPDLAAELEEFLDDYECVNEVAGPLRALARAAQEDVTEPCGAVPAHGGVATEGDRPHGPDPTRALKGVPSAPPAGAIIRCFGDYLLTGEIARGGMGVVYRAHQVSLNRTVAIKMILAGRHATDADVQRFRNEAEAVAHLDHPGIVPIYEVGVHDGRCYFSMKLIDGGSLASRLPEFSADPRATARLLAGVARAVHHAHRRGVLHRDLKPSNILLDAQGQPHVTDFGLAKRVEDDPDLTQSGAILASPPYMAPEQTISRGAVTTATDVYGLGAVLYAMLTGRPPFRADSLLETLERVRHREPEPPNEVNRRVDRDLQTVCLKCMEKDPARRYATAEELADDLDRFLAGWPILARRPGALDHLAKWARRNPALLAGAIVMLVLTVVGLSLAVALLDGERARTARERDTARERTIEARDAAETLRWELYVSRVRQAHGEWLANNVAQAEQILESCPADLRGWEWFYCKKLCHLDTRTLRGHTRPVLSLAINRDGTRILSAATDVGPPTLRGEMGLWDATTGRAVSLRQSASIRCAATNPAGELGAIGNTDGRVVLVDLASGRPIRKFQLTTPNGPVWSQAFSADGRQVAAATGDHQVGVIELFDVATGKPLRSFRGHSHIVRSVAFHPDGKWAASASEDGTVRVWDAETGREVRAWRGDGRPVYGVAFSPDGSQLASAGWDRIIRVRDAARDADAPVRTLVGHTGFVLTLAFSPDGTRIASGAEDNVARVWDARTGLEIAAFRGHSDAVRTVAFGTGGAWLASGSDDTTIKLWDLDGDHHARVLRHDNWVNSVAYGPDGKVLASAGSDGVVKLWDARTGREIRAFRDHTATVNGVAFSPDGRLLASAGWDGTVRIWDVAENAPVRTITGFRRMALTVTFSPDGASVASSGLEDPWRLWDVASGRELDGFATGPIGTYSLAFSPDGTRIASADLDQTIRLWEVGTRRLILSIPCPGGHSTQKSGILAFSPDGTRIAATVEAGPGSRRTHEVKVWDASTGREVLTLRGHSKQVNTIAFGPDGGRIATASNDGTVKLWESASGREVFTLRGKSSGVIGLAFSPDGQQLATGGVDATVRIWDAPRVAAPSVPEGAESPPAARREVRHRPD